jgi:hypothetical protein
MYQYSLTRSDRAVRVMSPGSVSVLICVRARDCMYE